MCRIKSSIVTSCNINGGTLRAYDGAIVSNITVNDNQNKGIVIIGITSQSEQNDSAYINQLDLNGRGSTYIYSGGIVNTLNCNNNNYSGSVTSNTVYISAGSVNTLNLGYGGIYINDGGSINSANQSNGFIIINDGSINNIDFAGRDLHVRSNGYVNSTNLNGGNAIIFESGVINTVNINSGSLTISSGGKILNNIYLNYNGTLTNYAELNNITISAYSIGTVNNYGYIDTIYADAFVGSPVIVNSGASISNILNILNVVVSSGGTVHTMSGIGFNENYDTNKINILAGGSANTIVLSNTHNSNTDIQIKGQVNSITASCGLTISGGAVISNLSTYTGSTIIKYDVVISNALFAKGANVTSASYNISGTAASKTHINNLTISSAGGNAKQTIIDNLTMSQGYLITTNTIISSCTMLHRDLYLFSGTTLNSLTISSIDDDYNSSTRCEILVKNGAVINNINIAGDWFDKQYTPKIILISGSMYGGDGEIHVSNGGIIYNNNPQKHSISETYHTDGFVGSLVISSGGSGYNIKNDVDIYVDEYTEDYYNKWTEINQYSISLQSGAYVSQFKEISKDDYTIAGARVDNMYFDMIEPTIIDVGEFAPGKEYNQYLLSSYQRLLIIESDTVISGLSGKTYSGTYNDINERSEKTYEFKNDLVIKYGGTAYAVDSNTFGNITVEPGGNITYV